MLDKEFKYYLDHQEELVPLYDGKYIVIIGNEVVGAYENREDAYYSSMEKLNDSVSASMISILQHK